MKNCNLLLDTPFVGGKVVVFDESKVIEVFELDEKEKHSLSLFRCFSKIDLGSLKRVYFNVGPGNFSSLRVAGMSGYGLIKGLNLEEEDFLGFSYLDLKAISVAKELASNTRLFVGYEDNRKNVVGSIYHKTSLNIKMEDNYIRLPQSDLEEKEILCYLLDKNLVINTAQLVEYLNSSSYIFRLPWSLLYYQKSYFEK